MMAHEVNNTVGPVNSIMQSALGTEKLWKGAEYNGLKDALQVAVDRNQNLNLFMRNFADLVKLPAPAKKPVDLHRLVNGVVKLMEIRARESQIEITVSLATGVFIVGADEQQLEQALINILKNAMEAIGGEGEITVSTSLPDKSVVITDTGPGIDPANAVNIFSPFFSTKKDGQGIGLTLVREILLNHNFEFSLKTVTKKNTRFTILFN
jgi:two-component system nitrogen regulation sensor histidine kinase NtrY